MIETPCNKCNGSAKVSVRREVIVNIPPGVDSGTNIRLKNQGEPGDVPNAPRGHLYVECEVSSYPYFKRHGCDIHVERPIPLSKAVLGGELRVETLEGDHMLEMDGGIQPGAEQVLRRKGVPKLNSGARGDFIVHFKVRVPTQLTPRQRELIQEFASIEE